MSYLFLKPVEWIIMLTIKVLFKSGKEEVFSFHDFSPHIASFNHKLEQGVIQDYEILG